MQVLQHSSKRSALYYKLFVLRKYELNFLHNNSRMSKNTEILFSLIEASLLIMAIECKNFYISSNIAVHFNLL